MIFSKESIKFQQKLLSLKIRPQARDHLKLETGDLVGKETKMIILLIIGLSEITLMEVSNTSTNKYQDNINSKEKETHRLTFVVQEATNLLQGVTQDRPDFQRQLTEKGHQLQDSMAEAMT